MPRTRTTPESIATAHYDTVDFFAIQIAYDSNLEISLPATEFIYGVSNRNAGGQAVKDSQVKIPWGDIPAPVKVELKSIFQKVLVDAEAKGLVGAGTDSSDLP